MKHTILGLVFSLAIAVLGAGCSKDNDSTTGPTPVVSRSVKYEITGNYSGHFTVVYTNKSGGMNTVTVTALPWSLSFDANSDVAAVAMSVGAVVSQPGVTGQKATAKIFIGGKEKRASEGLADEDGYIISLSPGAAMF